MLSQFFAAKCIYFFSLTIFVFIHNIVMSADDKENDMLGCLFKGAAFYLVKPVTMNDIRNLWQFTFMKKTDRTMASEELSSISSEHDTESQIISKRARREEQKEMEKDVDNSSVLKKPKLIWTEELHNRFLQAIRVLGIDGTVFLGLIFKMCIS